MIHKAIAFALLIAIGAAWHPVVPRQGGSASAALAAVSGHNMDDFAASISRLDDRIRNLMRGRSWRPGCPVKLWELRLLRVTHQGFDRNPHIGALVVHKRWADEMVRVFRRLYRVRFPIRRMRLVDHYGANDRRSMAANNTSAFNCRWRAGVCCIWSQHAYGRAIDINPVQNPYLWGGGVSPPAGEAFLDRSDHRKGMIHRRDAVWRVFRAVGWEWGGDWSGERDYQHFSANGR